MKDKPVPKSIEQIIGTFISLKFDVDTDDFADGTLERYNNMLQDLNQLIELIISESELTHMDNSVQRDRNDLRQEQRNRLSQAMKGKL